MNVITLKLYSFLCLFKSKEEEKKGTGRVRAREKEKKVDRNWITLCTQKNLACAYKGHKYFTLLVGWCVSVCGYGADSLCFNSPSLFVPHTVMCDAD